MGKIQRPVTEFNIPTMREDFRNITVMIYLELETIYCLLFQFLKTDVIYMWQLTKLPCAKKSRMAAIADFDGCVNLTLDAETSGGQYWFSVLSRLSTWVLMSQSRSSWSQSSFEILVLVYWHRDVAILTGRDFYHKVCPYFKRFGAWR